MDDTKDEDLKEIHYYRKKVQGSVKTGFLTAFVSGWKCTACQVTGLSTKEKVYHLL